MPEHIRRGLQKDSSGVKMEKYLNPGKLTAGDLPSLSEDISLCAPSQPLQTAESAFCSLFYEAAPEMSTAFLSVTADLQAVFLRVIVRPFRQTGLSPRRLRKKYL